MTQLRPLTSSEINALEGRNLYVLNRSDRGGSSRSELLMTFNVKGQSRTVVIPNTWIPIDLTSQVNDLSLIKDNEDFQHHLRKKVIAVIDTEVAEEVLKRRDASEEYNRVYDIASVNSEEEDMDTIDIGAHQSSGTKVQPNRVLANVKVLNIVNKQNLSESNKIAALKNMKADLKSDDYKFIINQPKNDENEKLKAWASQQLAATR